MTESTHNADAVRALGSLQLWLDKAGLQLARE